MVHQVQHIKQEAREVEAVDEHGMGVPDKVEDTVAVAQDTGASVHYDPLALK